MKEDLDMLLSQNFTLREAVRSQVAARLGINNTPPDDIITKLRSVALYTLQLVRDHYRIPFSPSSWYRCLQLNRAIGSQDTSQHIRGEAVDIEVPSIPNIELAQWIMDNLEFDQLILEFYIEGDPSSGWVHVSYVTHRPNRMKVLTASRDPQHRMIYRIGLPT